MHRLLFSALVAFSLVTLNSCETMEGEGPDREYAPAVLIPADLSDNEQRLLSAVEDTLEDAGYRLTRSDNAEYQLEFEIDDGPVNADVYLNLLRNGSPVVKSYARTGGPSIIFKRQEVIRESFDICLRDFARRLPSPSRYNRPASRDSWSDRDRDSHRDEVLDRDHPAYRDNEYLRGPNYNPEYARDPQYYQ